MKEYRLNKIKSVPDSSHTKLAWSSLNLSIDPLDS